MLGQPRILSTTTPEDKDLADNGRLTSTLAPVTPTKVSDPFRVTETCLLPHLDALALG